MKMFLVTLRDNRERCVEAESYRREGLSGIGDQYVFDGTASGEVEFFVADEVVGITVIEPGRASGGGAWT